MTTGCVYSLTEIDGWNRVLVCVAALESTLLGGGGGGGRGRETETDRQTDQTVRQRERVAILLFRM